MLTLLTVPVAVIAFEFGWRVGIVAAVIATVWVVVWNQLHLSALGYFARGATHVLTALVVGLFADRLRAAQAAAMESSDAWPSCSSSARSSSPRRSPSVSDWPARSMM